MFWVWGFGSPLRVLFGFTRISVFRDLRFRVQGSGLWVQLGSKWEVSRVLNFRLLHGMQGSRAGP